MTTATRGVRRHGRRNGGDKSSINEQIHDHSAEASTERKRMAPEQKNFGGGLVSVIECNVSSVNQCKEVDVQNEDPWSRAHIKQEGPGSKTRFYKCEHPSTRSCERPSTRSCSWKAKQRKDRCH